MFSWLFGGSADGKNGSGAPTPSPAPAASSAQSTLSLLDSGVGGAAPSSANASFDPTVLERVAKAAKELQENREPQKKEKKSKKSKRAHLMFILFFLFFCSSAHAGELLSTVKEAEKSWQRRFEKEQAEAVVKAKEKEIELAKTAQDEVKK